MTSFVVTVTFVVGISSCTTLRAQNLFQAQKDPVTPDRVDSLRGRRTLGVALGGLDLNTRTAVAGGGGVRTSSKVRFFADLEFASWFENSWAVTSSLGFTCAKQSSSADMNGIGSTSETIIPILIGIRYYRYPVEEVQRTAGYFSLSIGPHFRFAKRPGVELSGSSTEVVLGARLGFGADRFFGDSFRLGVRSGYHFVPKFKEPIGSEADCSGYEFVIDVGYLWVRSHDR
jgi:hypothetical protein